MVASPSSSRPRASPVAPSGSSSSSSSSSSQHAHSHSHAAAAPPRTKTPDALPPRPFTTTPTRRDRDHDLYSRDRGPYPDIAERLTESRASRRTGSIDSSSANAAVATATAATVQKVKPALRLNAAVPVNLTRLDSASPSSSKTATPSTGILSGGLPRLNEDIERPGTSSEAPVLPDLALKSRNGSGDLFSIPGLQPLSPGAEKRSASTPTPTATAAPRPESRQTKRRGSEGQHAKKRKGDHHRSHSQKQMLASALQKANTAVKLDNAENYEGAMEAYSDACALLNQVMVRAGQDEDKKKLQTIKNTYLQRIDELKAMPPRQIPNERELPPRPLTEDFTDEGSLYTLEDNESTTHSAASTVTVRPDENGVARSIAIPPPRGDSLYTGFDDSMSPLSDDQLASSVTSDVPEEANETNEQELHAAWRSRLSAADHRESFTFGAAALSPRFSPRKADEYGIRRSSSNASTSSSRSQKQSSQSHSREPSTSEVSTSWLDTIDESGSSAGANGEDSPGWVRRRDTVDDERAMYPLADFQLDFDAQLDDAVEAAYGAEYEVDYSFDRQEEEMMMMSPRLNVEKAKERVRQVEREMEEEIQREKERRTEREKNVNRDSDLDFLDVNEESDEEERMLEEMTRGYTLDFEFNMGSKSALPRESNSTTYSDSTLARSSTNSGYSSGTTWGSSFSQNFMMNKPLGTVTETPTTPPPLPPGGPPGRAPSEISPRTNLSDLELSPTAPLPSSELRPPMSKIDKISVRHRRLSGLSEQPLEPLKIETASLATPASIPTTIVRGPSPKAAEGESTHPPPTGDVPPIPTVAPLNIPPKSPTPSRPGTATGQREVAIPEEPETPSDADAYGPLPGRRPSSPIPPSLLPPTSAIPLQKTNSDDGVSMTRSESPASFRPRLPGIPGLRQIHSSASLRNRNVTSPDPGSQEPPTPATLFASSSTSNLRKGISRSTTPQTPAVPPTPSATTALNPPATAGLPTSGMNLFDQPSPTDSPTTDFSLAPYPLEPLPAETLSRPYWLMRALFQTLTHVRGGYVSQRLFVPREVWHIKNVKLKAIDDKISACDLVTAALLKLKAVEPDDVTALFDEMQSLEGVLDRAQGLLAKKLGNEVGAAGAKAAGLGGDASPDGNAVGGKEDMVTKMGNVGGGGKSYFSLRKLRTKASSNALGMATVEKEPAGGAGVGVSGVGGNGIMGTLAAGEPVKQPKRDVEKANFAGPNAVYCKSLAMLFDAAQILDGLSILDDLLSSTIPAKKSKIPTSMRIGLELSHRQASEFFGLYICRFVLADVTILLDKFVKRGSEWVAG